MRQLKTASPFACYGLALVGLPFVPSAYAAANDASGDASTLANPLVLRTEDETYRGFEQSPHDLTVLTESSLKLRLTPCGDGVVKVLIDASGTLTPAASYAVPHATCPPTSFTVRESSSDLRLITPDSVVRITKSPLLLDYFQSNGVTPVSLADEVVGSGRDRFGRLFSSRRLSAQEHIYGLGQDHGSYLGTLDRRGTIRDMWTGQTIRSGHITAEYPIPFLISSGGQGGAYGFFFDNTYRTSFDLGKSQTDAWRWHSEGGDFVYYFIAGPSIADVVARYTALTGRSPMPPLWSLGYFQSKCSYQTWDEIDDVINNLTARGFPLDTMAFDFDWAAHYQDFQWNARWQGLSPEKLQHYRTRGINFIQSNSGPMLHPDSPNYQSAKDLGLLARNGAGEPVNAGYYGGHLMDFTRPEMGPWLWSQLKPRFDEGIAGWWLDLIEPEGEPAGTIYHGGSRDRIHNVFPLLVTKTYHDMQLQDSPDRRPFFLARSAFAGSQRFGAALWTGDTHSDYVTMAAHVPEGLNAGMSGINLWTQDAGGFLEGYYRNSEVEHGKLYTRWMQYAAFTPIPRAHHVGKSAPYMFGAEVEDATRQILKLRYRLLPYIYSYMWENHQTGAPLMRPLFWDDNAELSRSFARKDQYLFGREFLVAPVLTDGADARTVYVPQGIWYDYHNQTAIQGPGELWVPAPLERLPLFVRAGAIIPMGPFKTNTAQGIWDPISLDIYPYPQGAKSAPSRFTLYRDDGLSLGYTRGDYTTTTISSHQDGSLLAVTIEESNKLYTPKTYEAMVHAEGAPSNVQLQGLSLNALDDAAAYAAATSGWYWNQTEGKVYIKWPSDAALRYELSLALVLPKAAAKPVVPPSKWP